MNTGLKAVTLVRKRDRREGEGETMKTPKTIWKQMTVRIPHEVHKALKIRSAEEEKTVGEVVERLIREYLVKGARHA